MHGAFGIALGGQRGAIVHRQGEIIGIKATGLFKQAPGLRPVAFGQRDFRSLNAKRQSIRIATQQAGDLLLSVVITPGLT